MKNFILISVAFLAFVSCAKSQKQSNDWKKMKLNGKVKSIRETTFRVIQKFGEIQKGDPKSITSIIFTPSGDISESELSDFYTNGTLSMKIIEKYEDKGNISEQSIYQGNGSLILKQDYKYKYNNKGNLSQKICMRDGYTHDSITYKYDGNGNLIEVSWITATGKTYSNGVIKNIDYTSYKISYKYDDNGNLSEENNNGNNLDGSGTDFPRIAYKYDDKKNLIEKNYFGNRSESSPIKVSYKYEYDQNLNWVKKYAIASREDWEGKDDNCIKERVIEYF